MVFLGINVPYDLLSPFPTSCFDICAVEIELISFAKVIRLDNHREPDFSHVCFVALSS